MTTEHGEPSAALAAPTGVVTFVFTDIESSTALWETGRAAMEIALPRHDAILRDEIARHGGYEMRTEGDSFKVVFASPVEAVAWAIDVQRRLSVEPWPEALLAMPAACPVRDEHGRIVLNGLRVRMGIHLGTPTPRVDVTTGRQNYFGPSVNTAARVADAPHGGQLVVSAAVREAIRAAGELDIECEDLGVHQLKGVAEPMRLFGIHASGLPRRTFPALRTATARRTNLDERSDPFVGRAAERQSIRAALSDGQRLVTLVGPGGSGKTRLIVELALELVTEGAFAGGVWFVDLSDAHTSADVALATARALRAPLPDDVAADAALRTVGTALSGLGRSLIVLDNCEQVLEGARQAVRAWLPQASSVQLVATSREPLGARAELVFELSPLRGEAGVDLFIARARDARHDLQIGDDELVLLRSLVDQLDGLPLAIELAAARADVLSVRAIHDRLSQRFRLLARSTSDRDARHLTLRGALDWSWDLLDASERRALAQCSVFRGGFTVEAAEGVLLLSDLDDAPWAMDLVQSLRTKSLLVARTVEAERRLDMLVSVHMYAAERRAELDEAVGHRAARRAHARHYAALAERCGRARHGPSAGELSLRLFRERDNIYAAVELLLEEEPLAAARAIVAAHRLFVLAGGWPDTAGLFDRVVALAEEAGEARLLARALEARGYMLRMAARTDEARVDLERALALLVEDGLADLAPWLHMSYGATFGRDALERALPEFEAARVAFLEAGDPVGAAIATSWMCTFRRASEDPAMLASLEAALEVVATRGGPSEHALVLVRAARLHLDEDHFVRAQEMLAEAFVWHDRVGARNDLATTMLMLAICAACLGDLAGAAGHATRGLEQARPLGETAAGVIAALEFVCIAIEALTAREQGAAAEDFRARYHRAAARYFEPGPDGRPGIAAKSFWATTARRYTDRLFEMSAG